tara:strand:- start:1697 stop:2107 length:411 start_codon:yes stop_codon:yes gene_type:complete
MKKFILLFLLSFSAVYSQITEYKIVTSVESIVPMGLGRSRVIINDQIVDHSQFDSKRENIKIDDYNETKLLNFFSGVGINFQNIASNDAVLTSVLNSLSKDGWKLTHVATGVESYSGPKDQNGLFITRYIFERQSD